MATASTSPPPIVNPCPACGADVPATVSFCPACGADVGLAATRPREHHPVPWLALSGLIVVAAVATFGWLRYRTFGPGPDLATTVRWAVLGDGARHGELATLSRGYETARAVCRSCIDGGIPNTMAGVDWQQISRYTNNAWRGFTPLVQWAAGPSAVEGRLAWLLAVDGRDGWGRPWRPTLTPWPDADPPTGFHPGMLAAGAPPPRNVPLLWLTLTSAGPDGTFDTQDDVTFEAIFPKPPPIRVNDPEAAKQRELDLDRGLVWVRWSGTAYDIVDGRILGEFYLTSEHGD